MTYTAIRVTSEDNVVSTTQYVPSWSVCNLKPGDRIRLQSPEEKYSPRVWTVVGFGDTRWHTPGVNPVYMPMPADSKECPVWQR